MSNIRNSESCFLRRTNDSMLFHSHHGFTLIEVMIGLALSLIAMIVVLQVFSVSNSRKSVIVGGAEAQQIASVASFQMGRLFKISGSGVVNAKSVLGCRLKVTKEGVAQPPASLFSAPFAGVDQALEIAPFLVYPGIGGNGSDVVLSFSDNSAVSTAEYDVVGVFAGTPPVIPVVNSIGIQPNDFLLLTNPGSDPAGCFATVGRVSPAFVANSAQVLIDASGGYAPQGGYGSSGANVVAGSRLINLGKAPSFVMYGVDDGGKLIQQDLIGTTGSTRSIMAENIVDFRVLYGVNTGSTPRGDPTRLLDAWVEPTGPWSPASVLALDETGLSRILALKMALVVRSAESAPDAEPKTSYDMFSDSGTLKKTISIAAGFQKRRHQVFESVIPLRNFRLPKPPPIL